MDFTTQLVNVENTLTMSSLEIAELTGKQHKNVLADIRKMLSNLEIDANEFSASQVYGNNNTREIFNLTKELADILLERYKGLNRIPHRLREDAALKAIEQILGISLIRQYKVLNYRIDGYDAENNVAYEIDEEDHKYRKEKDMKREKAIKAVLGCTFTRIKL